MELTQQRLDEIFAAHQSGNFELLLKLAKKLQQDFPQFVLGYKAAGVALLSLNRKKEAIAAMKQAVKLDPNDDEALSNLGQSLVEIAQTDKQFNEAKNILNKALEINPNNAVALNNLAAAYSNLGDFDTAKIYAEKAIQISPNYGAAHNTLSVSLAKTNQLVAATEHAKLATQFSPEFSPGWSSLIQCTLNIGNAEASANIADIAVKMPINYDNFGVISARMRNDNYRQNVTPEMISENIKNFQRLFVKKFQRKSLRMDMFNFRNFKNIKNIKKLKIGLVSGDLNSHAVATFLLNLLPQLKNNSQIEIFAYSNCLESREDSTSAELRKFCRVWKNISTLTDIQVAKLIYADKIQILFDLSGYTEKNRLEMFALKPAPVQISWIGWLGTTGIPTMDYFLADEFCVPSGEKYEQQFCEKVLRMPNIWEVLTPPDFPREIQKNFCKSRGNGKFIFASFNNPNKVNSKTLDLWCEVLRKSPENTQFIWLRGNFSETAMQEKFLNEFVKRGVSENQISLKNYQNYQNYLQQICEVDLILDSVQFSGMTTTAEALSLGTPTITLLGNLMPSRLSGSCINAIGDENLNKNFIFEKESDFVNQAVFFANNPQKLGELTVGLAEKARKSPLCDAELFAKNFEEKMWEVWNNFLEN